MRLQDKIDSVIAVGQANGKIVLDGYACAVLIDGRAAADVVEAIHVALQMGCSGNDILDMFSPVRLAIAEIMDRSK